MKSLALVALLFAFALHAAADDDAHATYERNLELASQHPFREFEKAVIDGDVATVKRMLVAGFPVSLQIPEPQENWEGLPPSEPAIHKAVRAGNPDMARLLLDHGTDANLRDSEGVTPLLHASDIGMATLLVSRGAVVTAKSHDGWQAIHAAASLNLELVAYLIQQGADPLAETADKTQPIHQAARRATPEMVAFFLARGAGVDAAIRGEEGYVENGWQPLHLAVDRGDDDEAALEMCRFLLSKGADVNALTDEGTTPLQLSKNPAITRLLLQHRAKADVPDTGILKRQPIHAFAMRGDVESIRLLLDHGVAVDVTTDDQETALDIAAFWGRTDVVRFLLERGAKPTERTMRNARRFDTNPLEIIQLLHAKGGRITAEVFLARPNEHDALLPLLAPEARDELVRNSAEILAEAAQAGDVAQVRRWVAMGAAPDQRWEGMPLIHHAVASGSPEMIAYLLSMGLAIDAKADLRDDDVDPPMVFTGIQPIHLAAMFPDIIPTLIRNGAKIDAATGEGWQPIHLAAAFGDPDALRTVIASGGDPAAKTRDGKTPLQLAGEFENEENAGFLNGLQ